MPQLQEQDFELGEELLLKSAGDELRYTLCPILVPDIHDRQGHAICSEEIRKAVWGMGTEDKVLDLEHLCVNQKLGRPVEKYQMPADVIFLKSDAPPAEVTEALAEIQKLQTELAKSYPDDVRLVTKGTAMLGVVWKPTIWEQIKKGVFKGMSIMGKALSTEDEAQ